MRDAQVPRLECRRRPAYRSQRTREGHLRRRVLTPRWADGRTRKLPSREDAGHCGRALRCVKSSPENRRDRLQKRHLSRARSKTTGSERLRAGHRIRAGAGGLELHGRGQEGSAAFEGSTVSAFFQDMRPRTGRSLAPRLGSSRRWRPASRSPSEHCQQGAGGDRPELKTRVQLLPGAVAHARELAEGVIADYERDYRPVHGRLRGLHRAPAAADRARRATRYNQRIACSSKNGRSYIREAVC